MRALSLILGLLGPLACTGSPKDPVGAGDDTDTDTHTVEEFTGLCTGRGDGEGESTAATIPALVVTGDVTWTVDFDEEAEAGGAADCGYSRTYEGTQVLDLGYLCPECEVMFSGNSHLYDGADCYETWFGDSSDRTELWGLSSDGRFFRANRDQYPMGELSEAGSTLPEADADLTIGWVGDYTLTDGGAMVLSATGDMRYTLDEGTLLEDPFPSRSTGYDCGWPQNDPGTLTMDYSLAVGATFPNVRLEDQHGDKVALWDLYGYYLVLDTAQWDCGPCRAMSAAAGDFLAQMEEEGVPVIFVSLLGNGLSEPWGTIDETHYQDWLDNYGGHGPLLFDRGFGFALFPDFIDSYSGEDFGYPTWLLIDPDMKLMHGNVGFGTWDTVAEVIREDWSGRAR